MHAPDPAADTHESHDRPTAGLSAWPEAMWHSLFYDLAFVARGDAGGSGRRRVALAILHVPLPPGLVLIAVGLATLLSDSKTLLHGGVGWLLIASLALTLLALAGLSPVSAGRAAAPVAEGLVAAAIVALVVALATPHVVWLTPVVATWAAALPFMLAVVGLHHRQAARSRREAAAA